jgi:hypothetical protein
MTNKIKKYLINREQNKKQKLMIKFLENVKQNKKGIFNYKMTDSFFHLYIKSRTYSLVKLAYYDIDMLIETVCYQLYNNRISINKNFFKGIK